MKSEKMHLQICFVYYHTAKHPNKQNTFLLVKGDEPEKGREEERKWGRKFLLYNFKSLTWIPYKILKLILDRGW